MTSAESLGGITALAVPGGELIWRWIRSVFLGARAQEQLAAPTRCSRRCRSGRGIGRAAFLP
jgi:hypothetical protein